MHILLAENERSLNSIVTQKLVSEGHHVDNCLDGNKATELLACTNYDTIILDLITPEADGRTIFRNLRDAGNMTPVLFFVKKNEVDDWIRKLPSDFDDYLVKPFSFAELIERIRILTQAFAGPADNILRVGNLSLNRSTHFVKRGRREIVLSAKEFELLEYLMQNKGVVLSKGTIGKDLWNLDSNGTTSMVETYTSYLRKKVDRGQDGKLIHTLRGKGYIFKDADCK